MSLLLNYSASMARRYLEINGIVEAFVWHDPEGFNVYLGSPADAIGFHEAGPMLKKDAVTLRDRLNARIREVQE